MSESNDRQSDFDVVIVGGGPAGSTAGTLLKKYNPDLRVLILEKAKFPRDHVGESQLPPIGRVLAEMECWDKIEAAGFPIKIGASYTWGATTQPWEFEFLPLDSIEDKPRPHRFDGWREQTAFQVDRARYDDILLRHAEEFGCEVREQTHVSGVEREGDRITSLTIRDADPVTAKWFIDATGHVGTIRRAMGVSAEAPTLLKCVAFWDYWENADLPDNLGSGATRVQVRSVPYGWIWYIPIGNNRTSVGLVCPSEYYKESEKKPAELYMEAIKSEPLVWDLMTNATPRGEVETTTDWSFVADRLCGENWFLAGESAGFADPILAAGLTLTHTGARDCAYTILELERGEHDPQWLRERYHELQSKRVRQHMRFAEYWYSANGCFDDIRDFCTEIAQESGLKLNPAAAFRWLSQGGLDDEIGQALIGGFDVSGLKQVQWRLSSQTVDYEINGKNVFKLNLKNAEECSVGVLSDGRIERYSAYRRGPRTLPVVGTYAMLIEVLRKESEADKLLDLLQKKIAAAVPPDRASFAYSQCIQTLEVMVNDYWVHASFKKGKPALNVDTPKEGEYIYTSETGRSKAPVVQ